MEKEEETKEEVTNIKEKTTNESENAEEPVKSSDAKVNKEEK